VSKAKVEVAVQIAERWIVASQMRLLARRACAISGSSRYRS